MLETSSMVGLYQQDFEQLKQLSKENNISIAEAIHNVLTGYISLTQRGPQFVNITPFEQTNTNN